MNQFVPQLMLGNPLCNSTGPPLYKPIWHKFDTWVFGAQYFFEIFNKTANKTQAHAATGELFPTREGEVIYTSFDLDKSTWSWTLTMGVRGDATRVSTLIVPAPFMGLIKEETSSWSEPVYAKAVSNACWELYGIAGAENVSVCASQLLLAPTNIHTTRPPVPARSPCRAPYPKQYPRSNMTIVMQADLAHEDEAFDWSTRWRFNNMTCEGHPSQRLRESHTSFSQSVQWDLFRS